MKYEIKNYKLDNGIEGVAIFFERQEYQLLSTFLSSDVSPFEHWIKAAFDKVISEQSTYEEVSGNVCYAEIGPKTTKVYDSLAEDNVDNWCEIDTKVLRQLIEEWCEKNREFKRKHHK